MIALCGGIVLEETLDLSFDRLLMMMMMMMMMMMKMKTSRTLHSLDAITRTPEEPRVCY